MTPEQRENIKPFLDENGDIYRLCPEYAVYPVGDEIISLDGDFTVQELEAFAAYMRETQK